MFLSHQAIQRYIDEGKIIIGPDFDKKNIRPIGVRLHLAKDILVPEPGQTVDITGEQELKYKRIDLEKEEFYLEPNAFVLGATYESIKTATDIAAFLDGRSTIARIGLTTHVTAAVIDGTFEAPHVVVLEMKNLGNFRIRLKHKDPIAMMIFAEVKGEITKKIQTGYSIHQKSVTPPNFSFKTGQDA